MHCYLDHDDHGEMTTDEVKTILDQLAAEGTLFLTFSGGEMFLRKDLFDLLGYARGHAASTSRSRPTGSCSAQPKRRAFARSASARCRSASTRIEPEVHDGDHARCPGSLDALARRDRLLQRAGAARADRQRADAAERRRLPARAGAGAQTLGVECSVDPTITPMMDGDRSSSRTASRRRSCCGCSPTDRSSATASALPPAADLNDAALDELPCSAGHTACYISPYGDVYPCVQFPLPSGNLRRQKFVDDLAPFAAARTRSAASACATCTAARRAGT